MNKAIIIGNLTKDPELLTTNSGTKKCSFTLGVSRNFASADGTRQSDFIPVVVWRAHAENCAKYLKKGSKAAVCGSIQTRSYDAADGSKRYVTEIVAEDVQFLSSKNDNIGVYDNSSVQDLPEVSAKKKGTNKEVLTPVSDGGDLPF